MLRGKLISHSKSVNTFSVPESLSPEGKSEYSADIILQAKFKNKGVCYIGNKDSQDYELQPGDFFNVAEIFHQGKELELDLNEIYCKVVMDGDGVNILRTEIVSA